MVGSPLLEHLSLDAGGAQVEAAVAGVSPLVRHREAASSSMAGFVPAVSLGGLHVLDDGPKANAWLELIQRREAFDELVTFFYDSFTAMAGRAGEFFHH